ncbi:sigma-70 family RNA polymerase sigma factor [Silvimonas amylolytica]|uniref:RNA polymerase sigma-70 factor, ECF subfamily n=1 Tax=Silvimonas amylolytica TaxID=449663 RepID=A0ABQ2PIJ0_9NEIS|nr:sigma-70 family RNA polymerase sigma factor [Silvimonas amylolytica]GGP25056.1 hypothetical protein GCM10010971_08750 [Silvimonas amylolytica]
MPRITDTDGALFERLRPRLKAISRRIVGNEADAEDVVQDCFLKWQNTDQTALSTPVAWLTKVVQHQSIDRLRQRNRSNQVADDVRELIQDAAHASPETDLLRRAELGEALACLLTRLSPSERLALVMHEVLECEHADIAAALGTQTVNARQHLSRARRRLREAANKAALPASVQPDQEQIQRFQTAIAQLDVAALITLLGAQTTQLSARPLRCMVRCANESAYALAIAA